MLLLPGLMLTELGLAGVEEATAGGVATLGAATGVAAAMPLFFLLGLDDLELS